MWTPSEQWQEARRAFEDGRHFEAHEAFENLWRGAEGVEREFYQGWVLVAAALHHRERSNAKGARVCLERAGRHWAKVPGAWSGSDLQGLLEALRASLGGQGGRAERPGRADEEDGR